MITNVTATDSALPVSLDEAKAHLAVLNGERDVYIQSLIEAATELVESETGRSLRTSMTVTQSYETWPREVYFNRNPVLSVTHVKYYDTAEALTTLASSNYRLHQNTSIAELEFDDDFSAPSIDTRENAVIVTYEAGHADSTAIPALGKHAVKLQLGILFGNQTPEQAKRDQEAYERCIAQLKPGYYR